MEKLGKERAGGSARLLSNVEAIMEVRRRSPELSGFLEDFSRLYEEMLDHFDFRPFRETGIFGRRTTPPVDVKENANGYTVSCELPGLDRQDLAVSIAGNVLSIKGGKKEEKTFKEGNLLKKATWYNAFYRSLPLPPSVDVLKSWAELKNGVLIVMLPKRKEVEARHLAHQRA
jgi:HSP20 family protein